jgi:circadian clock protein KaiC
MPADIDWTLPQTSTGVEGLDTILYGGLPKDRIYLIEGDPGTGKTTIAMQFVLEGIRSGGRALYITLSETKGELISMAKSHGWSLEGLEIFETIPVEANLDPNAQYTFFHTEEVELGETVRTILDKVNEVNPTHLVLDSLAELRLLAQDARRYRRQVLALKHYFAGRETTALLLDDRTSSEKEKQLYSIVHGVITLERMPREYGRNRRRLEISKIRGADYIDGFHDYVIVRGGVSIFPRPKTARKSLNQAAGVISSGVDNLDTLLGGGLDRGGATLILGPAGCGKTTLSMKYASAAASGGECCSIFMFDEGMDSLMARSEGLNLGMKEAVRDGKLFLHQIDPAEMSPGEFAHRVRQSVDKDKAGLVVIDSLNGCLMSMPQEQFLTLQLHELITYLNQRGVVTVIILGQHGPLGTESSVDVSYLADTIVLLRFFESSGEMRRAISVIKKRSSGHEQSIRELEIRAPEGLRVGEPLRAFRGILTGVPEYTGLSASLFADRGGTTDERTK